MLPWKQVFQNHHCVASFHLPFPRFQNLVCLAHIARKNAVPVFNFLCIYVWGGFWVNVADRQAWFWVWRFQLVLGATKFRVSTWRDAQPAWTIQNWHKSWSIVFLISAFEKAAFQSQDFVQIGWEDQDASLKTGVSKSPLRCFFPPSIPKVPKLSLLGSHCTEECSASFQLSVHLCLRRLLGQRGRSPSLILSVEISACSGCNKVSCFHLERCPASLNHPKLT